MLMLYKSTVLIGQFINADRRGCSVDVVTPAIFLPMCGVLHASHAEGKKNVSFSWIVWRDEETCQKFKELEYPFKAA